MTVTGILPPTFNHPPMTDSICSGPIEAVIVFAFRLNVGNIATGEDIWGGSANVIPIPPLIGEQMSIVSSSVQDGPAGTGILTLRLHYMDHNANERYEDLIMNGTVPVNTVATDIRFVNDIHALTAGTTKAAVGNITIFPVGVPATVYNEIVAGQTHQNNSSRMVPAGKFLLIDWYQVAPASNGSGDISLRATSHNGELISITPPTTIFLTLDNYGLYQASGYTYYSTPIIVPSLAIVKCSAFNTSGTPNVQCSWGGRFVTSPI
jgi:hypothetical protein